MKYLSKTEEYQSPIPTQGSFSGAWVETGTRTIVSEGVQFKFKKI